MKQGPMPPTPYTMPILQRLTPSFMQYIKDVNLTMELSAVITAKIALELVIKYLEIENYLPLLLLLYLAITKAYCYNDIDPSSINANFRCMIACNGF